MRIGVFSRCLYRLSCRDAAGLTGQKESVSREHDGSRSAILSERQSEGLERKNFGGKDSTERLQRELECMHALGEADEKFLAALDLRSVTDALLEIVVRSFSGTAASVWLLDGTTQRLGKAACRNPME